MDKKYQTEVRERWCKTDAYREYAKKTKDYTREKWVSVTADMDGIFARFARCKESGARTDSDEAAMLAAELQEYITENFYACTVEILRGLGQMYIYDERFRQNIDKHGAGTAEFVFAAIEAHCKNR